MNQTDPNRPPVSYVLAAMTSDEVHNAAAWLRRNSTSDQVEVVLAAPAPTLAMVSSRLIPAGIRLASAQGARDRKDVRVAGARHTTGLVVIVVDCDDDIGARLDNPFLPNADTGAAELEEPATWVGELPPVTALPAPEAAYRARPPE